MTKNGVAVSGLLSVHLNNSPGLRYLCAFDDFDAAADIYRPDMPTNPYDRRNEVATSQRTVPIATEQIIAETG